MRLRGLTLHHDGRAILRDVCLDLRAGESLCLLGASGSGKSLLAAAIMGLLPACMAASGSIELDGVERAAGDAAGLRALWHTRTCLLPQEPMAALAPLLRAEAQVRLTRNGVTGARAWLARFGLDDAAARRLPHELSGGMAQRLLAALAARSAAGLLIADEPTKGLDPARRADIVALLAGLRDAGRALLVITHDLAVARALGGCVAVLEEGRIAELGTARRVLAAPASRFARACVAADPAGWAVRRPVSGGACVASGHGLVLARARRRIAGPVELHAREGTVTALLGPSGGGKTTLGDTLLGLAPPLEGRVAWFDRPLGRSVLRALRPRFQKLHQDPTTVFPPGRRFTDSLADLRRLRDGTTAARRMSALLDRLHIPAALLDRRPDEVSGGEAQRLALARVLALRPALLVADEPSSRLDLAVQAEVLTVLRGLADADGLSVLLVTHDAAVARGLADITLRL